MWRIARELVDEKHNQRHVTYGSEVFDDFEVATKRIDGLNARQEEGQVTFYRDSYSRFYLVKDGGVDEVY